MDKLEKYNLKTGSVLVLNKNNINYLHDSYTFLKNKGIGFNIIPLMKGGRGSVIFNKISLTHDEYFNAWASLYDRWLSAPIEDYVYVSHFIECTRSVIAGSCTSCTGMAQCGKSNCSVDPEGNVYPCASVTGNPQLCYGNINKKTLKELFFTKIALNWRNRIFSKKCINCKWFHLCHAGCPSRSFHFNDGNYHIPDYYCNSIYMVYSHIERCLMERNIPLGSKREDHLYDGLPNLT